MSELKPDCKVVKRVGVMVESFRWRCVGWEGRPAGLYTAIQREVSRSVRIGEILYHKQNMCYKNVRISLLERK